MKRLSLILFVLLILNTTYAQHFKMTTKDSLNGKPKHEIVFSGFVNSIFNYDFVGLDSKYPALNIVSVPVGNHLKDPFMSFDAFQTRLRFNTTSQTKLGEVKLYVEGDFVSGTGAFRLRHALISVGRFDFGQTWSNFSDGDCWPNMTDYDGPPTGIWARPTMIRYHIIKGKKNSLALSAEGPFLDYQVHFQLDSVVSTANQDVPDFVLRYRFQTEKFHIQLGGVYRNIKYLNSLDSSFKYQSGYGAALSGVFSLFKRDKLYLQYSIGKGISRYLVGYEGRKWDAIATGNHDIELLPVQGGFLGFDHYWTKSKKFSSTIVFGYTNVINDVYTNMDDFMLGYWGIVNLYWYPINNMSVALEYAHAYRKDTWGQDGKAGRIQFMIMYNF